MVNIRPADVKELDTLVRLGHRLAKHEKGCDPLLKPYDLQKSKRHYLKEFRNGNAQFFVAESDDKVIGYIYGYIKNAPDYLRGPKRIGHLEACYVLQGFRGMSICQRLTNELLAWFQSKRVTLIELGVYAKNDASVVWKNLGFAQHHIVMRKFLR